MKKCGRCQGNKDDKEFSDSQFKRSGGICRQCNTEVGRIYRNNNLDKIKKYNQNYDAINYQNNKDRILANKKIYYQENKESILQDRKEHYQEHKENRSEYNKQYYQTNKKELITDAQNYYENHKDQVKKYHNEYYKTRRKTDPCFRIRGAISANINFNLKSNNSNKRGKSCLNYLPYTLEELKLHLEKQFESWMTWDNYGKYNHKVWNNYDSTTWTWQIDHIIPQSCLPYTSMDEDNFKKCWALSNIRPLSSKQNFLDGVKRSRHTQIIHLAAVI